MISSLSGLLNILARGLRGLRIWKIPVPGSRFRAPMLDAYLYSISTRNRICLYMCTNPLQNYSDDVSICLMYIWSFFKLHNFKFTRVLRFRTCAHHMWGAGQWLQKLIPKVCIHGDSYTLKESVGWHKRCGGTMGHHCRDLWSDPGSLCSPCAEELIHPLTFRRIVKSSEELRSLQSQSNRNCPKITG